MVGGEHSLKLSAPWLSGYGRDSVLKIFPQIISVPMNELTIDEGVCRTAPATLGLFKIHRIMLLFVCQCVCLIFVPLLIIRFKILMFLET